MNAVIMIKRKSELQKEAENKKLPRNTSQSRRDDVSNGSDISVVSVAKSRRTSDAARSQSSSITRRLKLEAPMETDEAIAKIFAVREKMQMRKLEH
ncbi:hypothetical protein JTB14_028491 [Gonioctena quinquepunctata]|nr:hypothetical protein JTB14_028491 [Gonioctena quinquepunctata]